MLHMFIIWILAGEGKLKKIIFFLNEKNIMDILVPFSQFTNKKQILLCHPHQGRLKQLSIERGFDFRCMRWILLCLWHWLNWNWYNINDFSLKLHTLLPFRIYIRYSTFIKNFVLSTIKRQKSIFDFFGIGESISSEEIFCNMNQL